MYLENNSGNNKIKLRELDTSKCKEFDYFYSVVNTIPKTKLDDYLKIKKQTGFDVFNPNSDLFNDICIVVLGDNNTDIVVQDRREKYNLKISCSNPETCKYNGIDEHMYSICKCSDLIKNQESFNFVENSLFEMFIKSNFELAKCYNNIFKVSFLNNYGLIFFVVISTIWICVIILYSIFEKYIIKCNLSKIIYNDAVDLDIYKNVKVSNNPSGVGQIIDSNNDINNIQTKASTIGNKNNDNKLLHVENINIDPNNKEITNVSSRVRIKNNKSTNYTLNVINCDNTNNAKTYLNDNKSILANKNYDIYNIKNTNINKNHLENISNQYKSKRLSNSKLSLNFDQIYSINNNNSNTKDSNTNNNIQIKNIKNKSALKHTSENKHRIISHKKTNTASSVKNLLGYEDNVQSCNSSKTLKFNNFVNQSKRSSNISCTKITFDNKLYIKPTLNKNEAVVYSLNSTKNVNSLCNPINDKNLLSTKRLINQTYSTEISALDTAKSVKIFDKLPKKLIVKTLSEFNKAPIEVQLEIDKSNIMVFYWKEIKSSHEILNLFFYHSILNPFQIRFSLLWLSISIKLGLNAFFFSDSYIKEQSRLKNKYGEEYINFWYTFSKEFLRVFWPMSISILIKNIVNLIVIMPVLYIKELNKYLALNDLSYVYLGK